MKNADKIAPVTMASVWTEVWRQEEADIDIANFCKVGSKANLLNKLISNKRKPVGEYVRDTMKYISIIWVKKSDSFEWVGSKAHLR